MSPLQFLSIISVAFAGGCSSPTCGTTGAFEFGLTASNDQVSLVFGDLMASANNDCPDPAAPSGVISLTITGSQMSPETGLVTFCVPRPDQLASMALPLGTGIHVIDATATDTPSGCTFTLDSTMVPTGTAAGHDMCGNGSDKAGFGLLFDGFIGLRRTCGATTDSISVGLTGTVAVTVSSAVTTL